MLQKYMVWDTNSYQCVEDYREKTDAISFVCCGTQECKNGHRFGPNKREYHLLHFVLDGKGTLRTHGKTYQLEKNSVFLLRKGEEGWYEADLQEPWTYAWIGFTGHKANLVLDESGFKNSNVTQVSDASAFADYITEMLAYSKLNFESDLKRNGYLQELCSDLMKEYHKVNPELSQKEDKIEQLYVQQAIRYMMDQYSSPIKIAELANEIGINRSYLSTIFTKMTGVAPQKYLMLLRIERAKHLLLNTNAPIKNIGELVGYHDQLTFCKMFKKNTGYSPSEFRVMEKETEV